MRCQNGKMRPPGSMKRTLLSTLYVFLESCSSKSPGYNLKVDFSKAGSSDGLVRLFNENGPHGMLETSDFVAADNISPFLGAVVDAFCGMSRIVEVASAMTEYVGMVNLVVRRH